MVHDWTLPKWEAKLLADTAKLRMHAGTGAVGLQVILRLTSGQYAADQAPCFASVPAWANAGRLVRRAELPGGGTVEVRGALVPASARSCEEPALDVSSRGDSACTRQGTRISLMPAMRPSVD